MDRLEAIDAIFNGEVLSHPLLEGRVLYLDPDMLQPVILGKNGYTWNSDPFQYRHNYYKVEKLEDELDEL